MAYIDYKVSIWRRVQVKDEVANDPKALQELMNKLNKGLTGGIDIDDALEVDNDKILLDTEEYLSTEENDNQSTVELYDDNGNVLATNQLKKG